MGVASAFSSRTRTDTEYVIGRNSLLNPSGNRFRGLRWELNRFLRDHPSARIRPVRNEDLQSVLHLVREFAQMKIQLSESPYEREMAKDMESAHERAVRHHEEWDLEGWVLEEKGSIRGVGWYGLSCNSTVLVCFLEARAPDLSNMGGFMTRQVTRAMSSVRWVNIGGSGEISSIDRSKRARPHDFEIPLYSVLPD